MGDKISIHLVLFNEEKFWDFDFSRSSTLESLLAHIETLTHIGRASFRLVHSGRLISNYPPTYSLQACGIQLVTSTITMVRRNSARDSQPSSRESNEQSEAARPVVTQVSGHPGIRIVVSETRGVPSITNFLNNITDGFISSMPYRISRSRASSSGSRTVNGSAPADGHASSERDGQPPATPSAHVDTQATANARSGLQGDSAETQQASSGHTPLRGLGSQQVLSLDAVAQGGPNRTPAPQFADDKVSFLTLHATPMRREGARRARPPTRRSFHRNSARHEHGAGPHARHKLPYRSPQPSRLHHADSVCDRIRRCSDYICRGDLSESELDMQAIFSELLFVFATLSKEIRGLMEYVSSASQDSHAQPRASVQYGRIRRFLRSLRAFRAVLPDSVSTLSDALGSFMLEHAMRRGRALLHDRHDDLAGSSDVAHSDGNDDSAASSWDCDGFSSELKYLNNFSGCYSEDGIYDVGEPATVTIGNDARNGGSEDFSNDASSDAHRQGPSAGVFVPLAPDQYLPESSNTDNEGN